MKSLFAILFMFVIALPSFYARITPDVDLSFNVVSYGATGDGQTDDSDAFVKAWQDVCGATQGGPTLVIPKGKIFLLQPVSFEGPCKPANINIKLLGTIVAPKSVKAWKWSNSYRNAWIRFSNIIGLVINGRGQVDGQGVAWWRYSHDDSRRPTALEFHNCENLVLSTLTHINSPKNHISINLCNGSHISNLHIIAPEESPNTDGIDISESSNIVIENSTIQTGDDCIAINSGSSFINITDVFCGPGHGISVGSLGEDGAYETVEEVHVQNCTFNGTENGARIKTWMGGSGYARKITFEDIILVNTKNPVIIDQQYDAYYNGYEKVKAVEVSDVIYRNISGTSSCEDAIQLNCDRTIGCTNILLDLINITSASGGNISASCNNVKGTCSSCYPNVPCLSGE